MKTLFKFGVKIILRITWVARALLTQSKVYQRLCKFRVRVKLLK